MGTATPFEPERLLVALLYPAGVDLRSLHSTLDSRFGPADLEGPELPFRWTSYYEQEMGPDLRRGFRSYPRLVDPSSLAAIKLWTNSLEAELAMGGRRRFNLDPGLLSLGRLILATTKDRAHRLPIGQGVYGELTLIYEEGEYRPLPWTYADWRSPEYRAILADLRARLRRVRRAGS